MQEQETSQNLGLVRDWRRWGDMNFRENGIWRRLPARLDERERRFPYSKSRQRVSDRDMATSSQRLYTANQAKLTGYALTVSNPGSLYKVHGNIQDYREKRASCRSR
jgi:hypothetical protein